MIELERPGEEKKKRWEANTVAKSGGVESESETSSESEDMKSVSSVKGVKRDFEVEADEESS